MALCSLAVSFYCIRVVSTLDQTSSIVNDRNTLRITDNDITMIHNRARVLGSSLQAHVPIPPPYINNGYYHSLVALWWLWCAIGDNWRAQ